MRNLDRTVRMTAVGLMLALAALLAGCAATDAMWYDTGTTYSTGVVYTRPGTSVYYYDYTLPPATYSYYDPWPYGGYNFGVGVRDRDDFRGRGSGFHGSRGEFHGGMRSGGHRR